MSTNFDLLSLSILSVTLIFSIILSSSTYAQTLDDKVSQKFFNDQTQKCTMLLSQWESDRRIAVGLAVLVVILGAVSATIQGFQVQSVKIATAICGLAVTIATGLTNTVFEDHRKLRQIIDEGQAILA